MANSNVYMIPDSPSNSQFDPNMLYAAMMNNGNGGFGGNGSWLWVLFLFFLWPLIGNGAWGNGLGGGSNGLSALGNLVNNNDGRELLMQAIQGNRDSINSLANMFDTNVQSIMQAINSINGSISQVNGTVSLTGQQVISAINSGNADIMRQLCQDACSIKESITSSNYQSQISTLQQTQTLGSQINSVQSLLTDGFCRNGYEIARQFCETRQNDSNNTQILKDATQAQTQAILGKLDAMENSAMQDKITALTTQNNALTTQINLSNQNAITAQTVAQAVSPLSTQLGVLTAKVSAMECKQPDTVTTQYSPFTVVPNFPPYGAGYYNGYGNAWT